MTEILPVINCVQEVEVDERISTIKKLNEEAGVSLVHVDIADGRFTFHKTWNVPEYLGAKLVGLPFEVHLMVEEPEKVIDRWIDSGARRLIVHYEAIFDPRLRPFKVDGDAVLGEISTKCSTKGVDLMLSLNPETSPEVLLQKMQGISGVQVLAVHPGLPGQKFRLPMLEKISFLRSHFPSVRIEVDGGVTPDIIRRAKPLGVDVFTSDSFIFKSLNPAISYREIKSI